MTPSRVPLSWVPRAEFRRVVDGVPDPHDRCRAFATLTRVNALYMIMQAGSGHIGSSFSAADLVSWLLLEELREPAEGTGDVYFSSKGHDAPGLYAALIGDGRLDEDLLHRLRRIGGLPGHPDVHTPYMPFNTGSLGMGISKAKGLVLADRLNGRARRVFVLTGDGELQEGQNWEALAGAAHHGMGELTVVVDHNRIQSDTWVCDVSDLGDLEAKFASFGWGVLRCDGHRPAEIEAALHKRRQVYPDRPAVVIADTEKGAGCSVFAASSIRPGEWRYRFHSGAPAMAEYDAANRELVAAADALLAAHGLAPLRTATTAAGHPPAATIATAIAAGCERLPETYGHVLVDLAGADERVVALDADLVLDTGLVPFRATFPERFVECGIAEQDMVSMAGGLAAGGLLPFVHSFSCFLHARPNEHIYNNATERRKIIYVGSLAGLLPAGAGHSHQAVRDVAALAGVPGLAVLEPANAVQLREAVSFCHRTPDSVYLRLVSAPVPPAVAALSAGPLVPGRGEVIRSGADSAMVAIGAGPVVLGELLAASDLLATEGTHVTVVNLPWWNRLDPDWLADIVAAAEAVFVVENHYAVGGQADMVARTLLEHPPSRLPRFTGIGLTDIPRCGNAEEVLDAHGLSAAHLAAAIRAAPRPHGATPVPPERPEPKTDGGLRGNHLQRPDPPIPAGARRVPAGAQGIQPELSRRGRHAP